MASASEHTVNTGRFPRSSVRREPRRRGGRHVVAEIARYLGAVSILVVGAIHAQQYYDASFRVVPSSDLRAPCPATGLPWVISGGHSAAQAP